jgi:hypothetical protein
VFKSLKKLYREYIYNRELKSVKKFRNVPYFIVGDRVETREGDEGVIRYIANDNQHVRVDICGEVQLLDMDDLYCLSVDDGKSKPHLDADLGGFEYTPMCKHSMTEFKLKCGSIYLSSYKINTGEPVSHPVVGTPTLGCYLDKAWLKHMFIMSPDVDPWITHYGVPTELTTSGKVPSLHVDWPDRGVIPIHYLNELVNWCIKSIDEKEILEMGCYGAHGRTGTLLAAIMVKEKSDPKDAIETVRNTYCKQAIETKKQENLIAEYAREINPFITTKSEGGHNE